MFCLVWWNYFRALLVIFIAFTFVLGRFPQCLAGTKPFVSRILTSYNPCSYALYKLAPCNGHELGIFSAVIILCVLLLLAFVIWFSLE